MTSYERTDLERAALDAADRGDADELSRLSVELDRLDDAARDRLSQPDALARAALWYSTAGVPVFPLQPGGKRPHVGTNGFKDATTDRDVIREWWTRSPASNIGAPTGVVFDVFDFDGPDGALAYASFRGEELWDKLPPIGRAFTPRGSHVFIRPTGDGNTAGLVPGVDYRGAGGYVVLPPSRRDDGRRYRWAQLLELSAPGDAA